MDSGPLTELNRVYFDSFSEILSREPVLNPWFTPEWLDHALTGIALLLEENTLTEWLSAYNNLEEENSGEKTIGLVLAGNIPMVGFHDILCVLASGHRVMAKPSSKDDRLIRKLAEIISHLHPETGSRITFTDENIRDIDAVIATGSNNSYRYFEYYFRNIPHILRKNRNGIAVLNGKEKQEDLHGLGEDIFTYFGMGCRNVTKIYIPEHYDLNLLMAVLDGFTELNQHNKYANNVDYHRSVYLMNGLDFLDNGVILLKEDLGISSPVGVVFYERYAELDPLLRILKEREEEIQCTVSVDPRITGRVKPGETQKPMPWDYADGVDTMRFLKQLK